MVALPVEDRRGPRSGFFVSTFDSVRVEVGIGHLGQGDPRPGHVVGVVKALRLVLIERVRPAVFELVEGERDGAASIPGVQPGRSSRLERRRGAAAGRRETPWSMATVAAESPGGEHLGEQSAGRVPHHGGLLLELADHVGRVVGNLLERLLGEDVRVRPRLFNRFRIVGPVRRQRRVTGLLEESAQLAQLLGSSQRPWMKTTGVVPEAFAASISLLSRSEMDAMPNSSRSQWKVIRPSEPTTSSFTSWVARRPVP